MILRVREEPSDSRDLWESPWASSTSAFVDSGFTYEKDLEFHVRKLKLSTT